MVQFSAKADFSNGLYLWFGYLDAIQGKMRK
jgi:hypothetical protein